MKIKGYFLDGKSSHRHEASLELSDHTDINLYVLGPHAQHIGHELIRFKQDAIKIESRLANTARKITLAKEQLFISDDHESIEQLAGLLSSKLSMRKWLSKLQSHLPIVTSSCLALIAFTYIALLYAIPKSSHWLAHHLPSRVEANFNQSLSLLDDHIFQASRLTLDKQTDLQILMAPYYQDFTALNIKIAFRSGIGVNAFALPDGTLVFSDDLIKLSKNDNELLAVLYHEIGHLQNKHLMRQAIETSLISSFMGIVTGNFDHLNIIKTLPELIPNLAYTMEFEKEADLFALEQMHQANIALDSFAIILQRIDKAKQSRHKSSIQNRGEQQFRPLTGYLSSHPITEERVQRVLDFKDAHGIID